jgi:hypothetical protein
VNRWAKITLVIGGYVAAVVAGGVAAWAYDVHTRSLPYDTSGGMYAGGELMASLAAFAIVALVPTSMALWFLRRHTGFWNAVAILSVGFASVGLVAVLVSMVTNGTPRGAPLMVVELLGLSQLLGAPFWCAAFILFTVMAPTREIRSRMSLAVVMEVVIGVFAFIHWFVPVARG